MADNQLTAEDHAVVERARRALVKSIERECPPRLARLLLAVAIVPLPTS